MQNRLELKDLAIQIIADKKKRKDNPLYIPCKPIKNSEFKTPALKNFIKAMYKVMLKEQGIGIAANQVGYNLQVFIIEAEAENLRYQSLDAVPYQVFINPVILEVSKTKKNFWHGCLSAPGKKRGNVATYEWLKYKACDENGKEKIGKLDGFASVIFQHEFRHLLGGTYMDYAQDFCNHDILRKKIERQEVAAFEICDDSVPTLLSDYKVGEKIAPEA